MSGFSASWLSLREPADHKARNPMVHAACRAHFAQRPSVRVLDLGCGTGSNLRAMAHDLPDLQTWTLVDMDANLLAAAGAALTAWADDASPGQTTLKLNKGDKTIEVRFRQADLVANLDHVLDEPTDLVTAAALFDLCSAGWISRFVSALAVRALPLHGVLTFDGAEHWQPSHSADAAILAAFVAHQKTDKGFGVSSGPDAPGLLVQALGLHGYKVLHGESPWRLGAGEGELMAELAQGSAAAVRQTGLVAEGVAADWLSARRNAQGCTIGHQDIFAVPG